MTKKQLQETIDHAGALNDQKKEVEKLLKVDKEEIRDALEKTDAKTASGKLYKVTMSGGSTSAINVHKLYDKLMDRCDSPKQEEAMLNRFWEILSTSVKAVEEGFADILTGKDVEDVKISVPTAKRLNFKKL